MSKANPTTSHDVANLDNAAFAICAEELMPCDLDDIHQAFVKDIDRYRRQAVAAACALQIPSKAMLRAGTGCVTLRSAYQAMISSLLSDCAP
jgi:hypothetical protein